VWGLIAASGICQWMRENVCSTSSRNLQRAVGSKVHSALQAALLADRGGGLLTGAKGFTIEEVRLLSL